MLLVGSVLVLGAVAPLVGLPPAGAFPDGVPTWMIRSTAVNLLDAYLGNDTLAENAFDQPSTLETSAPHGWLSQDVQTYSAYGPATTPGSLLYALENGKVPAGASYLLYDDEAWSATPLAEQQDPAYYMSLFVTAAHDYGYGAILSPAVDLATSMSCYKPADPDWANYLTDCALPRVAAEADPDVVELQAQRFEDDLSAASGCGCYAWFVDQAAAQAAAADPFTEILAGLSSDHSGVVSTPQNLYDDTLATEGQVDGYWLNLPQQSGACPSCTPGGAPQVAAGYLWLLGYEGAGSQSISFTPPAGASVGTSATLTASGGPSGSPVTFSVDPASSPGACTLSGTDGEVVTYGAVGACVIDADQAGDADWNVAPQATATVAVGPGAQSIEFTPPAGASVGTSATLTASGGPSGSPVTFSVDPASAAGACTLSGTDGEVVTYGAVGACVIDADQAGDADWNPAQQVTATLEVAQGSQAIAFQPLLGEQNGGGQETQLASGTVGTSATLSATGGGSTSPVVFSVDPSSTAGACSVSGPDGTSVSFAAAGSCVIDANQAGDPDYLAAPQASETVPVGPGAQTIAFSPPPTAAVGTTVTLSATGGSSTSPVVFSVDASTAAGVCALSGVALSIIGVGSCLVDANQAGDANWSPAAAVVETISATAGGQAIAFSPPPVAAFGASLDLTATGGPSGNPVVFSVDPSSGAGVCEVAGDVLSVTGVGTCVLDADQAGNGDYDAAPEVVATITTVPAGESIALGPPPAASVGTSSLLSATGGGSTSPVVFSVDPASATGVCGVSGADGAIVSFLAVGTCVIDANQAGDADHLPSPQVSEAITVAPGSQTIALPAWPAGQVGTSAPLSATGGGSTSPVVFSVDATSGAGVCAVSGTDGDTVTFTAAGSCVIDAGQAGDANYLAATPASETVAVLPGLQTISFTPPATAVVGTGTVLAASGGASGQPVVFSVDPASGAGVCAVSGSALTFTGVGACVVDANEAGDSDWQAAPEAVGSVTVAPGQQQVTFSPAPSAVYGTSLVLTATGGASGNPVTFSVDTASGAGVCALSGATLSFTGAGTCLVDAEQAGDADWLAAPEATAAVTVTPAAQTVTFTSTPPSSPVYGAVYTASAAGGGSGNPVSFSSGTPAVCAVTGATVSFVGVGACTLLAGQQGDADYSAALAASQTFYVSRAPQTLVLTTSPPAGAAYAGPAYTVAATGGPSGRPVTFSSATSAVCAVAGDVVSFVGVGTCTVDADQMGTSDYAPAPEVAQSFAVAQATQTVTFTSAAPTAARYAGPTYAVTLTGGASGNPVVLTSGRTTVCTVSGSTVSFVGVGTCTLQATQAGNADYAAAPVAKQSFVVYKSPQSFVITSTPPATRVVGGRYVVTYTLGASGVAVVLSSATPTVCGVSGSKVSFLAAGTCTVDANEASNADYYAAPEESQTFSVAK